jgi:hypothetical protein
MKHSLVLTSMILSALASNAQNLTNVQTVVVNYTNVGENNTQQQLTNVNFNNDMNPSYAQYAANLTDVQVQTNSRGRRNSSALQNLGNSDLSNTHQQNKPKVNNQSTVQTTLNNDANDDNPNRGNRGNVIDNNDNVNDNNEVFRPFRGNVFQKNINNVANENRGGGGNIVVNDVDNNSNPVVNDTKKTVASKPVVQDYPGMDFKPSGLSGRDYSNGGKLKKGQKNFYTPTKSKHKSFHKRKPGNKKVKHHTSKCAKW